jgi:hypothetical protein
MLYLLDFTNESADNAIPLWYIPLRGCTIRGRLPRRGQPKGKGTVLLNNGAQHLALSLTSG